MSIQKFQEAKSNLAFSQSLMDQLRGGSQPDIQQSQGGAPQETPQEAPQEEQQEQQDVAQTIKDTMEPYLKKIEELVASKTPKDVSLKIDGTMEPKQ